MPTITKREMSFSYSGTVQMDTYEPVTVFHTEKIYIDGVCTSEQLEKYRDRLHQRVHDAIEEKILDLRQTVKDRAAREHRKMNAHDESRKKAFKAMDDIETDDERRAKKKRRD